MNRYCLWLLECSHDTGKQYAVMFFGLAFQYKVVLDIFDKQVSNSAALLIVPRDTFSGFLCLLDNIARLVFIYQILR
jgi:hypothetical protein